jgi:hemerythrin superfamily protein
MGESNVVDLLIQQHVEIRRLFGEVRDASAEQRPEAFERLVRFLAVHEAAEEEVVHPEARQVLAKDAGVVEALLAEENDAKQMLSELERAEVGSLDFDAKFAMLERAVLAHADREETEELPALRAEHDELRLQAIGVAVKAAEAMAPTHPHPGLQTPAENLLVGPFVGMVDRVRDVVRHAMGGPGSK